MRILGHIEQTIMLTNHSSLWKQFARKQKALKQF